MVMFLIGPDPGYHVASDLNSEKGFYKDSHKKLIIAPD